MKKTIPLLIVAALASTSAASAYAQFYIGGSVGRSDVSIDGAGFADQFLDLGFESATTRTETKDTAFRVFGGYQLHRYFAIEAAYVDLGRFSYVTTVVPDGTLDARSTIKGGELSAVGLLPLGEDFSLYARVGAFASETGTRFRGTGSVELVTGAERQSESGTHAAYAAGASWNIDEHLSLRGEFARYTTLDNGIAGSEEDADVVSLGVAYRF